MLELWCNSCFSCMQSEVLIVSGCLLSWEEEAEEVEEQNSSRKKPYTKITVSTVFKRLN